MSTSKYALLVLSYSTTLKDSHCSMFLIGPNVNPFRATDVFSVLSLAFYNLQIHRRVQYSINYRKKTYIEKVCSALGINSLTVF